MEEQSKLSNIVSLLNMYGFTFPIDSFLSSNYGVMTHAYIDDIMINIYNSYNSSDYRIIISDRIEYNDLINLHMHSYGDTIAIIDELCNNHSIEYWRIKAHNIEMEKTLNNIE